MKVAAGKISNVDIAVYALYLLGGVGRAVHLEEITVKCHEMAAGRFAFELPQYKHFPDKKAVFYALSDANKEKAGALVQNPDGSSRGKGGARYQITERGVKWIKDNEDKIMRELKIASSVETKSEVGRVRNKLRGLKNGMAFKKFRTSGAAELSIYDLMDFLGCSFETSPSEMRQKAAEMKARAALVDDGEIFDFLRACEGDARFSDLLSINKEA